MSKPHQNITLNEIWGKFLNDIEHLFQYQTLRYSQWMLLYTHIFDYCTNSGHNTADLYDSLKDYLRNYLEKLFQSIDNLQEQDILEFYLNQWKKYRTSSKILHGICSYLNRHYIKRELDSRNSDISEIYTMSIQIWQQVVVQLFYQQITPICLNMIKSERNHEKINSEIIFNVIETYVVMNNINEHSLNFDNRNQNFDIYEKYFENQFFQDTQEFYQLTVTTYLQQHSIIEYLTKIPEYIDEEISRITRYLHPSTIRKLIKRLEEVLIYNQLTIINAEAKILMNDEKISELNLLFQTVNRIENGKNELKNLFENHIYQIGIEHINCISIQNFKIYIQTISDLHEKYFLFIKKTFNNDQEFIVSFNRAFQRFVNNNKMIETIGNTTIMAENLARYCDKLLRKGKKDEIVLEKFFDQIKIVLFYIQEKDVFNKFYLKFLAKRLLNQTTISNDYEKLMISNIQLSCGFEYVYKMKQMCQDIEISENILQEYSKISLIHNLNILILNSNAWLLTKPLNIILPNQLQIIYDNFNKYYQNVFQGKKLRWLYQYSKGELQTFFTDKIYTLQVSMYQMIILLLFNNSLELTIEKIHDQTQIDIDLLIQVLNSLCQSKILISKEINFNMKSIIKLSIDFTNEKYSINLNTSMKSNEQNDANILHKTINQDRILIIQAAIVRIMKLNKIMNQNLLIQTVIEQLNSHFNPNISMIKDCINILIKKEYLEQSSDNKDLLCYVN